MRNKTTTYKWAYLPFVFSSAAILATQATAGPVAGSQQYQDARQVNRATHEYVGGNTQIGFGITDDGDTDVEFNQVLSEGDNHSTSAGLWAGYDLQGDEKGLLGRGAQINHNWVSRDASGRATRVNKVFAAYDRNEADHEKATVGYGQENEHLFWEGHVSKGLSGRKDVREVGTNGQKVSDRAYAWGAGGSVGKFLPDANMRIRAGLDHEWSDKVGAGEKDARNTTLSAGIEKFFQGTGHSLSLDVAGSKQSGGYLDGGTDDTDVTGRLGYKYDFGGASIYQPDRRYRRVRVEVPGKATPPRYVQKQQFKRVPTYKTVPVYGKKTVKKPYKQLVKSTMELEGQTFFKLNSSKLIPSAQTRLKQIAAQIRKSGYKGSIRITGNTCGLGDPVYDQILSEKRAKAVKNFLIKNGFNPDHLVARGLGKGHPKYPRTPDQDFKNRRVDIEYVSEKQIYKTGYRTETQNVQTGTRQVATGFKNIPAGSKNVMIDSGRPGAPRVVWRTEAIPTSPAWIKRALHNNIQHDRSVNTYTTTEGFDNIDNTVKAANDKAQTLQDVPVTINVLSNDDADATITRIVSGPSNGSASIVGDQIVYTPNPGFSGTDSLTYEVTDPNGNKTTARVDIVVIKAVNTGPVAVNDVTTASCSGPVTINVLGNDSDADNDTLTVISFTQPANGTVKQTSNGVFVYTPNTDACGTDETFEYTISDGNNGTDTATVTVSVDAELDDTVKAVNDLATTDQGQAVTVDVLNNDDADASITRIVTGPSNGSAAIVDGQIVYTPNAGFVGDDTFTYEVQDPQGNKTTATVTVTVNPADNGINAANDSATTDEGEAVTINVLSNDDADASITRVVSNPSNGSATIVNGQIVYTPDAGFSGTDTFTYEVQDPQGNKTTATVTVTVNPADNGINAANDSATTDEGKAVTINVLSNDDADASITRVVSNPSNGSATIVNGQIVYTPNAGFSGTDTFTYEVQDPQGNKTTATVTVTVNPVDDDVKAANDSATTGQGEAVTIDVLDNDDADASITRVVISPSNGSTSIVGGQIVYTPNANFSGTDTFTYEVQDPQGNKTTATVTVTVTPSNTKPDAVNDSETTGYDEAVKINVLGNDTDPENDALTVESVTQGTEGGTVTILSNGQVEYTPASGFTGTDTFTYTISDGNGGTDTATVTVTVEGPANTAPIANDDSATAACSAINIDVLDNDSDPDGDTLSIIGVDGVSPGAMASIVGGMIVYTPNPDTCGKGGSDSFTYTISDGNDHTASATVNISLKGVSGTDINAEPDDVMTKEGESVDIHPLRNDSGTGIRIIAVDTPKHGTVTFTNSKVTYTPDAGYTGMDSFWYDIVDSSGAGTSALIVVDVMEGCVKDHKCN
ncbi:Ig-like domain-containing protein [uncultured Cocleimonas sp.]|uniref:Ig-like domain-containing protein n=1 Tax=uncultured Cocleimonas sp. TaxID=1051587 RepID=UPI00262B3DDB|nr:Ig-like domain-containing protein [uncultured Cocleimonas sp.]